MPTCCSRAKACSWVFYECGLEGAPNGGLCAAVKATVHSGSIMVEWVIAAIAVSMCSIFSQLKIFSRYYSKLRFDRACRVDS